MKNETDTSIDLKDTLSELLSQHHKTQELIKAESDRNVSEIRQEGVKVSVKLDELTQQNERLAEKIDDLKVHNLRLKEELKKNTSDRMLRLISLMFFAFFSVSVFFYLFFNFELVKFQWAKIGVAISTVIFIIGHLVGKMYKNEFNGLG